MILKGSFKECVKGGAVTVLTSNRSARNKAEKHIRTVSYWLVSVGLLFSIKRLSVNRNKQT